MILNGRQPPADSLSKIKTDDNQAKFLEISKAMEHSTRKP